MSPIRPKDPTPAEWTVLRLVHEHGPLSTREVMERLEGREDWSRSTVKTLLRRLVDKGQLKAKPVGNANLYRVAGSPLRSLKRAADELMDRASGATVGPLLAHLVERSELDAQDLDELRALVDRLAEDAEEKA